jgi:hypothetical protein
MTGPWDFSLSPDHKKSVGRRWGKIGQIFSRAAKIGQSAQGRVLVAGNLDRVLALFGGLMDRLEISRHVSLVHRPFNGLHSIIS